MSTTKGTIAVWFSCGAASAVAAKKTIEIYGNSYDIHIVNNPVIEEHEDNKRFSDDVANWLGYPIITALNPDFPTASAVDVWNKRKGMSFPLGAPCTIELKKKARQAYETENKIDWHVLGFTLDEKARHDRFTLTERTNVIPVLIDAGITKQDCFVVLNLAGIKLPEIYNLGFPNANCIGCVKATSPTYWNLVREKFPGIFNQRAEQSKRLGAKLVRYKGERIQLEDLPATAKGRPLKTLDIECSSFCEEPERKETKMARGRKPAQNETAKALAEALAFLAPIKPVSDLEQSYYTFINEGVAVAYNGVLAAGTPVPQEFNGYPNTKLLGEAIKHVGKKLTLTVISEGLSILSGDYHSIVPFLDYGKVIPTPPDANVYAIDNRVKDALTNAGQIASDTGETIPEASVLFNGQTIVGTNKAMVIESWHGYSLPIGTPVPKAFVNAVAKSGKDLAGFGMGQDTITVHFTDGSWIRTQYYKEGWPETVVSTYPGLFETSVASAPPPKGLFDAIKKVQPFAVEDCIILDDEHVQTQEDNNFGARASVKGLYVNKAPFRAKYFNIIEQFSENVAIDDMGQYPKFIAYGGTTRSVVAAMTTIPQAARAVPTQTPDNDAPTSWTPDEPTPAPEWGQGRAEYELAQMAGDGTPGEPQAQATVPDAMPDNTADASRNGPSAQASASPSSEAPVSPPPWG